jgi:hypothetical protein
MDLKNLDEKSKDFCQLVVIAIGKKNLGEIWERNP